MAEKHVLDCVDSILEYILTKGILKNYAELMAIELGHQKYGFGQV
jgi:hypothetical protein